MPITSSCKRGKDKTKSRIHEYVVSYDGENRVIKSCKKCANVQVSLPRNKK